jgi:hypothetical protein
MSGVLVVMSHEPGELVETLRVKLFDHARGVEVDARAALDQL